MLSKGSRVPHKVLSSAVLLHQSLVLAPHINEIVVIPRPVSPPSFEEDAFIAVGTSYSSELA